MCQLRLAVCTSGPNCWKVTWFKGPAGRSPVEPGPGGRSPVEPGPGGRSPVEPGPVGCCPVEPGPAGRIRRPVERGPSHRPAAGTDKADGENQTPQFKKHFFGTRSRSISPRSLKKFFVENFEEMFEKKIYRTSSSTLTPGRVECTEYAVMLSPSVCQTLDIRFMFQIWSSLIWKLPYLG